tara:strand:+ start:2632 stop:3174 length:543 start_codon:yes stop_codon:yes gene_type:complete
MFFIYIIYKILGQNKKLKYNNLMDGWSINKVDLDSLSSQIKFSKWSIYKFHYDLHKILPKDRGLYMYIANIDFRDKYFATPMYIGHTIDLNSRFKQHIKSGKAEKCYSLCGVNNLEYSFIKLEDADVETLKDYEDSLIKLFGPKMNIINARNNENTSPKNNVTVGEPIKLKLIKTKKKKR